VPTRSRAQSIDLLLLYFPLQPMDGPTLMPITPERLGRELADVFNNAYNEETNMCECECKQRYENEVAARRRLSDELAEAIRNSQKWENIAFSRLGERNDLIDQLESERKKHTETLKLLQSERADNTSLRQSLAKAVNTTSALASEVQTARVSDSFTLHRHNVSAAVKKYSDIPRSRPNHPFHVATAVIYLLDRVAQLEMKLDGGQGKVKTQMPDKNGYSAYYNGMVAEAQTAQSQSSLGAGWPGLPPG